MLNNPVEYTLMAQVEKDHWWYRILHERVIATLPNTSPEGRGLLKILDVGCGTGGLIEKLKFAGYANVMGTDVSETAVEICRKKRIIVTHADARKLTEKFWDPLDLFDVIICNDVLCYFTMEEISSTIEGFKSLLKPSGLLIMNNPAHAEFSGNHDVAVGIVTRFNPTELKTAISYHLSVISLTEWPFLLSPLVYLTRKLQSKKGELKSDVAMPSPLINKALYGICKLEMKLFNRTPFGSSVFIVAKKTS